MRNEVKGEVRSGFQPVSPQRSKEKKAVFMKQSERAKVSLSLDQKDSSRNALSPLAKYAPSIFDVNMSL